MIAVRSPFAIPALTLSLMALPVTAQESAPETSDAQDSVLIGEGEVTGNSGRIAVNIAAGSQNQQAGSVVIGIGELSVATHAVAQDIGVPDLSDRKTAITVGPNAYSNNSGLLSVNASAGTQNQSANLASLTVGTIGVVSDQMLAQTSAPTKPAGPSAHGLDAPNDSIAIDDSAFSGNSGLVQINLVGGERNSSANTFALNVSAGGQP